MAAYPFCRLSGPANVLVMPARHSAAISTNMLQELGGSTVLGPLLVGFDRAGADPADLGARFRHRQHGGAGGLQYQRVRAACASGEQERIAHAAIVLAAVPAACQISTVAMKWSLR